MNNLMNKLMNKGRHQKKKEEKVNLSFIVLVFLYMFFVYFQIKKISPGIVVITTT